MEALKYIWGKAKIVSDNGSQSSYETHPLICHLILSFILKPVFDALWNACGYKNCLNYDENGKYRR